MYLTLSLHSRKESKEKLEVKKKESETEAVRHL